MRKRARRSLTAAMALSLAAAALFAFTVGGASATTVYGESYNWSYTASPPGGPLEYIYGTYSADVSYKYASGYN